MKRCLLLTVLPTLLLLSACVSSNTPQPSDTSITIPIASEQNTPERVTGYLINLNSLQDIVMKTEYDFYPIGVSEIKTYWENGSQYDVTYGEYYEIYKMNEEEWTQVVDITGRPYPALGYGLYPGTSCEKTYGISDRFGKLGIGEYKIFVHYHVSISGSVTYFVASAGFSISENA